MRIDLTGKVALVNAGSQGIGKAVKKGLSEAGAVVCITARTRNRLMDTAGQISQATGNNVSYFACDLVKPESVDEVYNYVRNTIGEPDILINNNGGPKQGFFFELSSDDFQNALDQSLLTSINFTRKFAPYMLKRKWGRIINISSTLAKEPTPSMILSSTARAGLSAFSKALSIEMAPNGVTINTVCPGGVLTERLTSLLKEKSIKEDIPYDELVSKSSKSILHKDLHHLMNLPSIILFLSSEHSSYLTGTVINVDGSLTKYI